MQTTEQRLERLEKHNRRLTTALTLMAVAMCAVVTMAATGEKDGYFDTVTAQYIFVKNDAGEIVVSLSANDDGNGLVKTYSAQGKTLVQLNATVKGKGMVTTHQRNGKRLVTLGSAKGNGTVTTYQPNGKEVVSLSAGDEGGVVNVYNKTGEGIAQMAADEYGNGRVGAYNRKGMGARYSLGHDATPTAASDATPPWPT